MLNMRLKKIISLLYIENKKIHIRNTPKYLKIIHLMALDGTIDHTLAYKLNYKLLTRIEPFVCEIEPFVFDEVKNAK